MHFKVALPFACCIGCQIEFCIALDFALPFAFCILHSSSLQPGQYTMGPVWRSQNSKVVSMNTFLESHHHARACNGLGGRCTRTRSVETSADVAILTSTKKQAWTSHGWGSSHRALSPTPMRTFTSPVTILASTPAVARLRRAQHHRLRP